VIDSKSERRPVLVTASLALPLIVLTALVVLDFEPLLSFDADVVRAFNGSVLDTGWLRFFRFVAVISGELAVTVLLVSLVGVFGLRRQWQVALWIATTAAVNAVGWPLLKILVHRSRPDLLEQIAGHSFPSGHAAGIAAAMGVLVVVTRHHASRPRFRLGLICLWLAIAALVGLDRIFVGAHYPSDVIAGWLLGGLIVYATSAAFGMPITTQELIAETPMAALPDERRVLAVILNPTKVLNAEAFQLRFARAARAAGWDEPLWFETTVDDAGGSMARAAVAAGADLVVAAGGDGTVRVVCSEMAGTGIPVGVIPAGTGNLLARNLGIPLLHDLAIDTVLHGRDRPIDVVRIEGDSLAPTRFVVMAGLGLDAAIMDGAPDALKARLGWPAYVITGARHLRYPAVRVDISIDGGDPVRRRARTVVIGNVGSLQGGIPLLPDALIDDGVLDVVVVAPRQLFGWLSVVARVVTRGRRTDERLDRFTGTSVKITAGLATPRQLDGDTVGAGTELFAQIEPGMLLVRVPR